MDEFVMQQKKSFYITFGCKVNQVETEEIKKILTSFGYVTTSFPQYADLIVINTCVVTSNALAKSRRFVNRLLKRYKNKKFLLTGCLIDSPENPFITTSNVFLMSNRYKENCYKYLKKVLNLGDTTRVNLAQLNFSSRTRAFVKIQDGCDSYCSYCIVPYTRSHLVSKPLPMIIKEIKSAVNYGYKEIVLTGIHIGKYGKDLNYRYTLYDLIQEIDQLPHKFRLRLSSIEINEIDNKFISLISDSNKICHHLHIPLQSGDDMILKSMNRNYNTAFYLSRLQDIKNVISDISITTDVIIGFPGEEDKHFNHTLEVCRRAGFSKIHIFPFSRRPLTAAWEIEETITAFEKKQRVKVLKKLADNLALTFKEKFLNKYVTMLTEECKRSTITKTYITSGLTQHYLRVEVASFLPVNKFVQVKINKVHPGIMEGIFGNDKAICQKYKNNKENIEICAEI